VPRAELLTLNSSSLVVFTGISALRGLNVVIEQHLGDLSTIDVRANEPKLPRGISDDHSSHESRRQRCKQSEAVLIMLEDVMLV